MKQTIAIVGATEYTGMTIAKSLAGGPYHLLLVSDDEEKVVALKEDLIKRHTHAEVGYHLCAREASWEADIIILATTYESERDVARNVREVSTGKVVVTVSNSLDHQRHDLTSAADTSAAEELQKLLPYAKVVKTFYAAFAAPFQFADTGDKSIDVFIAGNNGEAVETVVELIQSAGYNPVRAGDLTVSRTLEWVQFMLTKPGWKNPYQRWGGWKALSN